MSDFLKGLIATLAGAGQGAMQGLEQQRLQRERDKERADALAREQRQTDQWQQSFGLQQASADAAQTERDFGRARDVYAMTPPDADLTTNPMLETFKKFGLPTVETGAKAPSKVSDTLTLPSMPGFTPSPSLGGAESAPMSAGKYDPNAEPEEAPLAPGAPKPLPVGGPMTIATPTFGMGAPGKTTRAETRQESMERVGRESEIAMLESLVGKVGPQYAPILQGSIDALKKGGRGAVTAAQVGQLIQESQPKPPAASAQPDFEFQTAFQIANGKKFDDTATPQELAAANKVLAQQKIDGTRAPVRATSGGSGGGGNATASDVPAEYRVLASQAIGSRAPAHSKVSAQGTLAQLWASGDKDSVNNYIRSLAIDSEPSTVKERITSRIETVDALKDTAALLRELKAAGVDTGIMQGGAEKMAQYLGSTGDPRLAALGTQLSTILMNYRRGITGAAFSASEAGEYAKIWPSISSNLALNEAQIDGLARTLQGADASYWRRKLGDKGAELVGAIPKTGAGPDVALSPDLEAKIAQAVAAGYSRADAITYLKSKGVIK